MTGSYNVPPDTPSLDHLALMRLYADDIEADGKIAQDFVDWTNIVYPLEKTRDHQRAFLEQYDRNYPYEMRDGVPRSVCHYQNYMTILLGGTRGTMFRSWMMYRFQMDTLIIHARRSSYQLANSVINKVGKRLGDKNTPWNVELSVILDNLQHPSRPNKVLLSDKRNIIVDGVLHASEVISLRALYKGLIDDAAQELNFYLVN